MGKKKGKKQDENWYDKENTCNNLTFSLPFFLSPFLSPFFSLPLDFSKGVKQLEEELIWLRH